MKDQEPMSALPTTNIVVKTAPPKKSVPPPGRKLSAEEARALANRQFGKALDLLATK
jgi:hypothetical protein